MEPLFKIGFYSFYEKIKSNKIIIVVDSGKIIYSEKYKKYFPNKYRDVKEFSKIEDAKSYVLKKLSKHKKNKESIIKNLPKSLYLIVMKEERTGDTFIKVGITSKKFIFRRFSKEYGYEGYKLETILRRIDTPDAEKLEEKIKDKIKKNMGVKKFRPIIENFYGYSECFSYDSLNHVVNIFDSLTKNH